MAANISPVKKAFLMAGMLVTGSLNTISKSIQNGTLSQGWDGRISYFHHPWFQTLIMFTGESLCFWVFLFLRHRYGRELAHERSGSVVGKAGGVTAINEAEGGVEGDARTVAAQVEDALQPAPVPEALPAVKDEREAYVANSVFSIIFLIPMLFDLTGTTLGGIGLLWVPPSVWQMMRGSTIIFSGILSVIFLKRVLKPFQWCGMVVTALGLVVVGTSGLLAEHADNDTDDSGPSGALFLLGILLILLGQVSSSCQMVIEEKFLKGKNYPPLQVVGVEGCYGVVAMVFVVLPVVWFIPGNQNGHYDDTTDAIIQLMNSWIIQLTTVLYCLSIAFYNFFGLSVAKAMTTVHRTLLDAMRIFFVWGIDLFIYYVLKWRSYGEVWTKWSFLELGGFGILLVGTFTYYAVIKWPFFDYTPPPPAAVDIAATESAGLLSKGRQRGAGDYSTYDEED